MEASSFVIGGAVAIAGALVTLASDFVRGFIERQRRIDDRRAEFQHATAVELQEVLYEIGKIAGNGLSQHFSVYQQTGKWQVIPLTEDLNARAQELRIRGHILVSRIDNDEARGQATQLLDVTGDWKSNSSKESAEEFLNTFPELQMKTNEVLGELIRDSWPGQSA